MKFTLDETGVCLADVAVQSFCEHHLKNKSDIHVSNSLVLDVLRATLIKMPIEQRPVVEWFIYGTQAFFDNDMRCINDAQNHKNCNIGIDALFDILRYS